MIASRAVRLATAVALTASLAGIGVSAATTASAVTSWPCSASGTGATSGAAANAAKQELIGDYTVLSPISISYDAQQADGSWYAVASARCGNPR